MIVGAISWAGVIRVFIAMNLAGSFLPLVFVANANFNLSAYFSSIAIFCMTFAASFTSAFIIPFFYKIWGKKITLTLMFLATGCGGVIAAHAVNIASYSLFCIASVCWGVGLVGLYQLRFYIQDFFPINRKHQGIALAMFALMGASMLGTIFYDNFSQYFAGNDSKALYKTFFYCAVSAFLAALLIFFSKVKDRSDTNQVSSVQIIQEKQLMLWLQGVITGGSAFFVMNLMMIVAPMSIHQTHNHLPSHHIINLHFIAMYLPAVFVGFLNLQHYSKQMAYVGFLILLASPLTGLLMAGNDPYTLTLIILGIGWGVLYLAGTSMLSVLPDCGHSFFVKGRADSMIIAAQFISSGAAGFLFHHLGWVGINILCLTFAGLMLIFFFLVSK